MIRKVSPLYAGLPEPPRNLRVTRCEANVVQLTWEPPDDNDNNNDNSTIILEYTVYYSDSSDPEQLFVGASLSAPEQGSSPATTVQH